MDTKKIKVLRDTACENIEGKIVNVAKDQEIEVPLNAADRLIELGSAEASAAPPPKNKKNT